MRKEDRMRKPPLLVVLALAAPLLAAQPSPPPARPSKSVRGTLQSVDARLGGVIMKTDDGKRMAWKFSPSVIAEVAKVAIGAPTIVIYRQTSPNQKRVTAIAFPGTAEKPTYVNLTGERVVLRTTQSAADGTCTAKATGTVSESSIPAGGRAEVLEGCWCCGASGGSCEPGTRSGNGIAYLEACFE
jgi:hypothetical protein